MNPVPATPPPRPSWREWVQIILSLPFVLAWMIARGLYLLIADWFAGLIFYATAWFLWPRWGKSVLLVTSDSRLWRDAIQERWISRLGSRAYVLNWSQRRDWSMVDLTVWAFHHFAGKKHPVPMAIVVLPFQRARVFHFYKAFKQVRGGFHDSLDRLEREFFRSAESSN